MQKLPVIQWIKTNTGEALWVIKWQRKISGHSKEYLVSEEYGKGTVKNIWGISVPFLCGLWEDYSLIFGLYLKKIFIIISLWIS